MKLIQAKPAQGLMLGAAALALAALVAGLPSQPGAQTPAVAIDNDDIGGVVTGPKGPEAGVWVIAETTDLPTKYAKIVVTDDQGRYVLPDLPKAKYKVWVRGYGLVDSAKVDAEPGRQLNLSAVVAPNEKAAAEYYPPIYWYSMLRIPPHSEFPGTGPKGNGINPTQRTQQHWLADVKSLGCLACHAMGTPGTRVIPREFGDFANSRDAWTRRIQAGQAMTSMVNVVIAPRRRPLDRRMGELDRSRRRRRAAQAQADAPAGRRAQRRADAVGLERAKTLSARPDRHRPAQSDGQRQRQDLRLARELHRTWCRSSIR